MTDELTTVGPLPVDSELPVDPELEGPDQALIDETLKFVLSRKPLLQQAHQAYDTAFQAMDQVECQMKIEIGQFLFEKFFKSDKRYVEGNEFHPYKKRSYDSLAESDDWPFSRSTVRNMLKCAVQSQWFRSQKINTDHLNFTHQVRLTRIPNDNEKKKLIRRIREENLSTRKLENIINGIKLKERLTLPETFDDIIDGYDLWIAPFLETPFISDLTKAKNNDPQAPVSLSRRKEMRETIEEIIAKFEKTLELLLAAKATLRKPKQTGSQASPATPQPNLPAPIRPT